MASPAQTLVKDSCKLRQPEAALQTLRQPHDPRNHSKPLGVPRQQSDTSRKHGSLQKYGKPLSLQKYRKDLEKTRQYFHRTYAHSSRKPTHDHRKPIKTSPTSKSCHEPIPKQSVVPMVQKDIVSQKPSVEPVGYLHVGGDVVLCWHDTGFTMTNGCLSYSLDGRDPSPAVRLALEWLSPFKVWCVDADSKMRLEGCKPDSMPVEMLEPNHLNFCPVCHTVRCHRHWAVGGIQQLRKHAIDLMPHAAPPMRPERKTE